MNKQFLGEIIDCSDEAENIKIITIDLHKKISFIPGQYVMLAFPNNPNEKRAFSIVSSAKNRVSLCIKKHGSFTSELFSSNCGSEILVFGPYGRFILPKEKKPIVFIAGGIGITPLYCMLHQLIKENYPSPIWLFYSAKSKNEMAFLNELLQVKCDNVKIKYFFTKEEDKKRISVISIEEVVPDLEKNIFYICGPVSMMNTIRKGLLLKGVVESQIRQEEF